MCSEKFKKIGWDIGGAHLKAVLVDESGRVLEAIQRVCPLWQGLGKLNAAVDDVLKVMGAGDVHHAVTMTGELADIFINRRDGVNKISSLMSEKLGKNSWFYAGEKGFVTLSEIDELHTQIASANWHASASYVAKKIDQGLLIDIGSSTTDLILLKDAKPANEGFSDAERMRADELVYTGVVRTPLMALAQRITFNDQQYHIAAEHFSTTADIYRITGDLTEMEDMAPTADGAGKTPEASMRRIARMLGHDKEDASDASWLALAQSFKLQQLKQLESAISNLLARNRIHQDAPFIGAGAGAFLVRELAQRFNRGYVPIESLILADSQELRHWAGICFPAYAVASLMPK